MRVGSKRLLILVLISLLGWPASAAQDELLTDMVEIMREEGVIDDAEYSRMREKAARRDAETSWWERLTFSGDLRVRYETFVYNRDALGQDRPSRGRARYRARLKLEADINDHIDAVVRISTGEDNSRSGNQTLGSGNDFDSDSIFVDRAYMILTPWADGALPWGESGYLGVEIGRMNNPFHWSKKVSPDYLLWDRDIGLEGIQIKSAWDVANAVQVFFNTGYYQIDENSTAKDPGLAAAQLGAHVQASEKVKVGARFTYYGFNNLDSGFLGRGVTVMGATGLSTSAGGNTKSPVAGSGGMFGLTGNDRINVIEAGAYLDLAFLEDWPITLFGTVSSNLSAQSLGFGVNDLAWMLGAHAGDKKKTVNAGLLYGVIEADAFPSQFIDSDFTDGKTNREGLSFWVTRQILANTDLRVETFYGEELETTSPFFDKSSANARRWRVRGDIQVKF